jgi:hypothetical protein
VPVAESKKDRHSDVVGRTRGALPERKASLSATQTRWMVGACGGRQIPPTEHSAEEM